MYVYSFNSQVLKRYKENYFLQYFFFIFEHIKKDIVKIIKLRLCTFETQMILSYSIGVE